MIVFVIVFGFYFQGRRRAGPAAAGEDRRANPGETKARHVLTKYLLDNFASKNVLDYIFCPTFGLQRFNVNFGVVISVVTAVFGQVCFEGFFLITFFFQLFRYL